MRGLSSSSSTSFAYPRRRQCAPLRLPMVYSLIVLYALLSHNWQCQAFRPTTNAAMAKTMPRWQHKSISRSNPCTTALSMSDISSPNSNDKDNEKDTKTKYNLGGNARRTKNNSNNNSNNNNNNEAFYLDLPPPPENRLVLAGDVLALLVYGFLDHFLCQDCAQVMVTGASDSPAKLQALVDSSPTLLKTPVWLDATSNQGALQKLWQANVQAEFVTQYSPILQPVGLATCLLASLWLLSGWWHQSFSFKNTLECGVEKSLAKTAQTWITTSSVLLLIVCLSQGGLLQWTKGDIDFILDSLIVVLSWRFLVSIMMRNIF